MPVKKYYKYRRYDIKFKNGFQFICVIFENNIAVSYYYQTANGNWYPLKQTFSKHWDPFNNHTDQELPRLTEVQEKELIQKLETTLFSDLL